MRVAAFLRREWLPLAIFLTLALVPMIAEWSGDRYLMRLATRVMIFAVAAISLDLILGYGGMVSFGHAAFLGLGGYACAILMAHGIDELLVALPVALAVAGLFALATGAVSLRTEGVNFIMITLAFAQMAYFTFVSLSQYGGDDGLQMPRRSTLLGSSLLEEARDFHFVVLAALAAVYIVCRAIVASRFGRVLAAARQNPTRVAALGFPVLRFRLAAYVIAGMICGLSGLLFANQNGFMSPALMTWQRSGELLIMVILGGIGALHGAILGAGAFVFLEEWLSGYTEHWKVIFGPLLIVVVLLGRGGLIGLITGFRRG